MYSKLKNKSIGRAVPRAVTWLIVFAALLYFGGADALQLITGPKTLDVYDVDSYVGKYVTLDVNFSLGEYCYTEPENSPASVEYVVTHMESPDDPMSFVGVILPKGEYQAFERFLKAYNSKMFTHLDEVEPYTITGTLQEMDSQSHRFFQQTLEGYWGLNASDVGNYYYIKSGYVGSYQMLPTILMGAGSALALLLALFPLVKALLGGYQKPVRAYVAAGGPAEDRTGRLEADFQAAAQFENVWLGHQYIVAQAGLKSVAFGVQDLVWAYQKNENNVIWLTLGTADGKLHNILVKRHATCMEALQHIKNNYPFVAMGFSQLHHNMFRRNRDDLRTIAATQRQYTAGTLADYASTMFSAPNVQFPPTPTPPGGQAPQAPPPEAKTQAEPPRGPDIP